MLVNILNTGVTGFAFLMLYLGYKLMSDLQVMLAQGPGENTQDPAAWESLAIRQLGNTRFFMVVSLVFFIGGLMMMAYRPEATVSIGVTPIEPGYPPVVLVQDTEIELNEYGRAELSVRDEHTINVYNKALIERLYKTEVKAIDAEVGQRELAKELAARSDDSGFGFAGRTP